VPDHIRSFQALAELVRIYRGGLGERDLGSQEWLHLHDPPLIELGPLDRPIVTDEGARVIGELLKTWENQT
jgi:hypothetical protein